MKIRHGFVSNSSSSSFIIIKPKISEKTLEEIAKMFLLDIELSDYDKSYLDKDIKEHKQKMKNNPYLSKRFNTAEKFSKEVIRVTEYFTNEIKINKINSFIQTHTINNSLEVKSNDKIDGPAKFFIGCGWEFDPDDDEEIDYTFLEETKNDYSSLGYSMEEILILIEQRRT